ncbi:MAG TPA: DUF3303 family protein [Burkholderiaceae bacterium]|nr:DUF3303 family protein [Burkholderiaceae bacterium]HMX10388.1 DUF3303 family protein [Burkholderiaceae bacterium]HMY98288.1 DUF3303 family protein [Burkholderiaceae bacterium]HNB42810.1 DUF3303 family protein [Burkholderiaceae bacterium]HNG78304.1 DUF3303 family protein [Burkholderiaceae bacterium]
MKYMICWYERPHGSAADYESVQKRVLAVFGAWKPPEGFRVERFLIRVGDWGGFALVECDDAATVHQFCTTFPMFEFKVHPVIEVQDAVRVEMAAMEWRDGLGAR